ncbi:hypothetical protein REPUB_Repub05bG0175200 [Reevesia pubescens]
MLAEGFGVNKYVILSILKAYGHVLDQETGKKIHSLCLKKSFESDAFVISSLIDMYSRYEQVKKAKTIFDGMIENDLVVLNVVVSGYARKRLVEEGLHLVDEMKLMGVKPDLVTWNTLIAGFSLKATISSLLPSCMSAMNLKCGKDIHGYAVVIGVVNDIYMNSALVDIYYEGAIQLFKEIEERKKLDHKTFTTFLAACRAGKLDKAYDVIKTMPIELDLLVYGALLEACRTHGNIDLAELATKHLRELEPGGIGNNLLLENLYADASSWGNVIRLKKMIKKKKLRKFLGCS